jgi:hypothetical protein
MPVTRPSRIAADLMDDKDDPEAVAQVVADDLRPVYDYPGAFADALAPYAASFGLRRGMASRSFAGSSTLLATRKHPSG